MKSNIIGGIFLSFVLGIVFSSFFLVTSHNKLYSCLRESPYVPHVGSSYVPYIYMGHFFIFRNFPPFFFMPPFTLFFVCILFFWCTLPDPLLPQNFISFFIFCLLKSVGLCLPYLFVLLRFLVCSWRCLRIIKFYPKYLVLD